MLPICLLQDVVFNYSRIICLLEVSVQLTFSGKAWFSERPIICRTFTKKKKKKKNDHVSSLSKLSDKTLRNYRQFC